MSARYRSLGYPQEPVSCLDQLYERDRQLLESHAGQDFNGCELSLGFAINRNKYLSCENERLTDELNRLRMVAPMAQVRVRNTCHADCYNRYSNRGQVSDCMARECDPWECQWGNCNNVCRTVTDRHRRENCLKDCNEDCDL